MFAAAAASDLWHGLLIEDVREYIVSQLTLVPRLCMARTCKAAWERWNPETQYLHACHAHSIVAERTPLWQVRKWALALVADASRTTANKEVCLAAELAREGWSMQEVLTTCMDLPSLCIKHTTHLDLRWDLLMGYVRGGHMELFRALWESMPWTPDPERDAAGQMQVDMRTNWRRCAMFEARLYRAAAEAGQGDILFAHLPKHTLHLYPVRYVQEGGPRKETFRALLEAGQFELLQEYIRDNEAARFSWETHLHRDYIDRRLLRHKPTFDHRIMDLVEKTVPNVFTDKLNPHWCKDVWERGRLADVQWLHARNALTPAGFENYILIPVLHMLGDSARYQQGYPRFMWQKDPHLKLYEMAELYLVQSPLTTWLMEHGYYKRNDPAENTRGYRALKNAWPMLRADMRTWLESRGIKPIE